MSFIDIYDEVYFLREQNKKLQKQLILSSSQNYCSICGNILDTYKEKEEEKHETDVSS